MTSMMLAGLSFGPEGWSTRRQNRVQLTKADTRARTVERRCARKNGEEEDNGVGEDRDVLAARVERERHRSVKRWWRRAVDPGPAVKVVSSPTRALWWPKVVAAAPVRSPAGWSAATVAAVRGRRGRALDAVVRPRPLEVVGPRSRTVVVATLNGRGALGGRATLARAALRRRRARASAVLVARTGRRGSGAEVLLDAVVESEVPVARCEALDRRGCNGPGQRKFGSALEARGGSPSGNASE